MKIRFKTTARGPRPSENWNCNEVREVPTDKARELIAAGLAEQVGPDPKPEPKTETIVPETETAEDPTPKAAERAVSHKRKGKKAE